MSANESPSFPDVIIELVKVSKTYTSDVQAIIDISLQIKRGEKVFLTGVSGAGKTTLLRLINRIEPPTKGMIEVAGFDLEKLSRNKMYLLRRKIGMASQDAALLKDRSVADNIAVAMEVVYTPRTTIERRTRELLEQLDLNRKYATRAGDLSRGEQQRVTIARAVANSPEIVLADEPTGNLDGETTDRVMTLFNQLNRRGVTLVIATHDTNIYHPNVDRVINLRDGRFLKQMPPETEQTLTVQSESSVPDQDQEM